MNDGSALNNVLSSIGRFATIRGLIYQSPRVASIASVMPRAAMLLRYFIVALGLSAVVPLVSGCAVPFPAGNELFARMESQLSEPPEGEARIEKKPTADSTESTDIHVARMRAMAEVLDELEEIRARDPHAQERLLSELKEVDPEQWPVMVREFHAALSFRKGSKATAESDDEPDNEPDDQAPQMTKTDDTPDALSWRMARRRDRQEDRESDEQEPEVVVDRAKPQPAEREEPIERPVIAEATSTAREDDDTGVDDEQPFELPRRPRPIAEQRAAKQAVIAAVFDAVEPSGPSDPSSTWIGTGKTWNQPLSSTAATRLAAAQIAAGQIANVQRDPSQLAPSQLTTDENWQQHLTSAIRGLSTAAADDPQSSREVLDHARLRLLQIASGQSDAALTPIPNLSTGEQDYWSKQLFALATYTDPDSSLDPKRRAALAAKHLDDALVELRQLGSLSVTNLAFCTKVYDFGAYDEFPSNQFTPGRKVTLYAEVENFRSRETEDGFQTSLASSYEIVDETGDRVTGGQFPDVKDTCRNRRRDFHIQYTLPLPSAVEPGHYRLKLLIEDNQNDTRGQNVIEFEIVGAGQ
jgi:hypothetical protein